MNTDTKVSNKLRDMNPQTAVLISLDGVPDEAYTSEEYLNEYDAAILEAKREGAKIILQQMEDVLYTAAASGELDEIANESPDYVEGVQEGAKIQLLAAKVALATNAVDFSREIR